MPGFVWLSGLNNTLRACLILAAGFWSATASAQSTDNTTIGVNYVYAAQLGIGTYDIGGLSVDVFTLPLSITRPMTAIVDPQMSNPSFDNWSVRFKFPVSFGIFDFAATDPEFGNIRIKQNALAIVPGLELIAPLNDVWALKPFVDLGLGKVVSSSGQGAGAENFFAIYTTGLRSLVDLPAGEYNFAVGNGLIFAGNAALGGGGDENYWAFENGLQVRRSLDFSLADIGINDDAFADVEPEAGLYFIYYYFPKPLLFSRLRFDPLEVQNQFEFGLTLGSATAWSLLSVADPQIGVSYMFGDDLEVLRVNFGFPF